MEERKKNLCAMIPESLHKKVREEQEEWGIKLNEYMERILKDHFEKAGNYSGMRQLKMKFVQICLDSLWICDIDF